MEIIEILLNIIIDKQAKIQYPQRLMSQRHPTQNEVMMLVTTNTLNRKPIFSNDAYAREAIECLYRVQNQHPFLLYGFVIMLDHCHLLMQILEPGKISNTISAFKSGLAHDLGIGPIWQRRFDNRIVKNAYRALKYIHMNPVKADLVEKPEDYPWSSASGRWDVTELYGDF